MTRLLPLGSGAASSPFLVARGRVRRTAVRAGFGASLVVFFRVATLRILKKGWAGWAGGLVPQASVVLFGGLATITTLGELRHSPILYRFVQCQGRHRSGWVSRAAEIEVRIWPSIPSPS